MDNEIDMLDKLKEKNIYLKEFEFDWNKIINIQDKFDLLISSNPALENLAVDAFKSYVFSYLFSKIKGRDNFKCLEQLDKEKIIRSFGLKKVPFIKIQKIYK